MQVRVFEAEDMNAGLRLVRKELGPDALILSTKTVKNGKLGLLGKSTIEITAAIDKPWPDNNKSVSLPAGNVNNGEDLAPPQSPNSPSINHTVDDEVSLPLADATPDQVDTPQQLATPPGPGTKPAEDALRSEVNELKQLVQQLADQRSPKAADPLQQGHSAAASPVTTPAPAPTEFAGTSDLLRQRLGSAKTSREPTLALLHEQGIEGEPAMVIADYALENMATADLGNPEKLRKFVIQAIEDLIDVAPPDFGTTDKQHRIALIGPTGVGKTTTLAKLAALYLTNFSSSIALITIDTYRIAAVEQLKVYGEIMHLPVEVVISPEQLEAALSKHADKELILIDTAGRSPKDTLSVIELSHFLRSELDIEKHLVLSAGSREAELFDTINRFAKVGIDRTVFTKVDECSQNGIILNIQARNKAPLSYITNGQRVPEDLLQINRRSVAEFIMTPSEGTSNE